MVIEFVLHELWMVDEVSRSKSWLGIFEVSTNVYRSDNHTPYKSQRRQR